MRSLDPAITTVPLTTGARLPNAEALTTVAPAANASGNGGNASPRPAATAIALAATLTGLTEGNLLEALVLGRAGDGGTVLKTPSGTFVTAPPAASLPMPPLPVQTKALLEVIAVADLLQARLVSVDDRPLPTPAPLVLRLTALAPRPPEPGAVPAPRRPSDAPSPERALRLAVPPPPTPLRAGQTLVAVLQPAALANPPQPMPNTAPPVALPARPSQSLPPAPPGALFNVRVVATAQPGSPPTVPPAGTFVGEIDIEGGPDHERLVLRLPGATLRLPPSATAVPGTRVTLEVLASAPPPSPGREPEADRLVTRLETTLAMQVAQIAEPVTRLAERIPAANRKLTAAAMLFLAAARQGDLTGWLDAALPQPARAEDEPLKRLGAAWRQHTGDAEPERKDTDAWRPWVLPFHDGVAMRPLTFHMRRRAAVAGKNGGETRFLLDLDLSALGSLQLDGLIRARRFDLMLRGAVKLDRTMRHELALLFQESLGALGYAGALAFRDERPSITVTTTHVEARA
jgi:hypothetical protein